MSNKVDIAEVEAFSNDLEEVSSDVRSSLDKVQERVNAVNNMESFSGKAAKEAKSYFNELHLTLLESFRGLFDDLNENLNQHIKSFGNEVDASESAVIESNYLQDVKEDINEVFASLKELDESIHDTIGDVSEISSATSPDFSDVQEWKKKSVKKIKEMDEDLGAFTSKDNEVDVQEIMHQIEAVMSKATTSKGKARFAEFKGSSDISELSKLMEYNENKKESTPEELNKDNIEEMSVSVIEKANDKEMKKLKGEAADTLNNAFHDLKEGNIDRATYLSVMNGLKSIDKGAKEGVDDIDLPEGFVHYLEENKDKMVDGSKTVAKEGLNLSGVLQTYGLTKKGFKIKRYETKGGRVGYRVYNPEVVGIKKPGKNKPRNHKIYYKDNIDHHAKKGKSGGKVPITDKVKPGAGSVSALKSKAGWVGIALDSGFNIKDNIQDGASTQKIVGDSAVDVVVGATIMVGVGALTSAAVGAGAPLLAGAAIGWGVTSAVGSALNLEWGKTGKNTTDFIKDGVQAGTDAVKGMGKTVAGWLT